MNNLKLAIAILIGLAWTSCSVKPEPIQYGKEQCNFCRMTIVDQQHAAQYVTSKGKQYKFDAIECMLNDMASNSALKTAYIQVAQFDQPGVCIPAQEAHYLISESIPSPMGANLTAFGNKSELERYLNQSGGEYLRWDQLRSRPMK